MVLNSSENGLQHTRAATTHFRAKGQDKYTTVSNALKRTEKC
jgi:hypothetical protein